MPDNTPQDNLAEEQQPAEELQDQESTAQASAEQDTADKEPVEQEVVERESAEQDAVEDPAEEPAQDAANESAPEVSAPEASAPEASKPEPPKKKPKLESVDGYVDELSRELDMEFADETEDSIEDLAEDLVENPAEDPVEESVLDIAEDLVEEPQADDLDEDGDAAQDSPDAVSDLATDSTLEKVALEDVPAETDSELLLAEDKIEEEQLEEERIVATFEEAPRNTQAIQEEARPEQRSAPEPPQPSPAAAPLPAREERPRKKKARSRSNKSAARANEPVARPNESQARPNERAQRQSEPPQQPKAPKQQPKAPKQRPGDQPAPADKQQRTPAKRVTRTYLKSSSLKQAFRNFGKLKGGVAWREVYAPFIVFMLLFALLSLAVVDSLPIVDSFNQTLNTFIQQTRGSLDGFVVTLTTIGDFLPMAGICLLICVILYIGKKWDSLAYFITNALLAIICIQALKFIFAVPRPGDETLVPLPSSFSFPSAHSFCSLVIFGLIGLLIFRALYARGIARKAAMAPGIILVIFAIFIGLSRIYVGVHWPSDVLGGWLLAGAWLSFAGALYTAGARQR